MSLSWNSLNSPWIIWNVLIMHFISKKMWTCMIKFSPSTITALKSLWMPQLFLSKVVWVLRRTNTVKIIWCISSFLTGGGRPQMSLRALFQAGTRVEPPMFRKLASSHEWIQSPWRDWNPQLWRASDSKSTSLTTRPRTPILSTYRCDIHVYYINDLSTINFKS